MYKVVGDTHANQSKWMTYVDPYLNDGDTIIVAGDFGYGFWNNRNYSEEMFFDYIAGRNYTVLFADGNHEQFDKLNSCIAEEWNGGRVHKIRHNLIHLMRGEIYNLEDEEGEFKLFTMGGGYSLDKSMRIEGVSWFSQEMPNDDEYNNAIRNLKNNDNKVDYIITHTCPYKSVQYLSNIRALGIKGDVREELPLTNFLEGISEDNVYNKWYFGHFHVDFDLWKGQYAVFNSIRSLRTGEVLHSWEFIVGEYIPFTEEVVCRMLEVIAATTEVTEEELEAVTRTPEEFIEEFGLNKKPDWEE